MPTPSDLCSSDPQPSPGAEVVHGDADELIWRSSLCTSCVLRACLLAAHDTDVARGQGVWPDRIRPAFQHCSSLSAFSRNDSVVAP